MMLSTAQEVCSPVARLYDSYTAQVSLRILILLQVSHSFNDAVTPRGHGIDIPGRYHSFNVSCVLVM
jgi:hypothetical protein